jgi:UDP-N-acetylglucosamine 2-epimerase (non-hydrolysing)
MRFKVMTVLGTRPEIIRLSRIVARLDQFMEQTIVHTGQHYDYELNEIFYRDLEIRQPDCFLGAASPSPAETMARVISETDKALAKVTPDAFLVLGDTNSCLAAIAAKRRKIPVFHMEAGNRCFDFRVPEEINRRIVDVVADVNLTYSDIARQYLLAEGYPADRVIKTGSPMFEVLNYYRPGIEGSRIVAELALEKNRYFLVSAHREENVETEDMVRKLVGILNTLGDSFGEPVVVSTHPRTRNSIERLGLSCHSAVRLLKPFGFLDYVNLQMNARVVLSDSGTLTEESSILNFPALNIREAHERPEGFEEASVMLTGVNCERILQAIEVLKKQPRGDRRLLGLVADYAVPNVSDKVLRIILSYTDYVKRTVWHQY